MAIGRNFGMEVQADLPTTIETSAPIVSRRSTRIAAPRARVWKLHTDVNAWPSWQPDIRSAKLNGAFGVGESFVWQTEGLDDDITSNIYAVDRESRTLWGGPSSGILGLHEWRFEQ